MKKIIVEFIGTFFLVLTIGLAGINPGIDALVPLVIGSVLMVMVYAGGHVSGAHYNPAVTIAAAIRGACKRSEVVPYITAQVFGALAAGLVVGFFRYEEVAAPITFNSIPALLTAEFLFTFALCYVVLNVATSKSTNGNSYYGLAIGFTVMVGVFCVGPISGGVFNPAVAVGLISQNILSIGSAWLYFLAQFAGAVLAAFVYKVVVEE